MAARDAGFFGTFITAAEAAGALTEPTTDGEALDAALMARLRRGDEAAYRRLLERHLPAINRFNRRLLGGVEGVEAEDITQETFLRLWTHASRWNRRSGRLSTWLHAISRNLVIDLLRKRRLQEAAEPPDETASNGTAPEASLAGAALGRQVQEAIGRLPERQRSALVLCHYQGFSNREAAAILGVRVEALESLLARARKSLRKLLAPHLEQEFRP